MDTDAEEALARLLVAARSTRTLIEAVPPHLVPADAASAYRTAQRVAEATGEVRGGWKIGATAVDNLHELGAAEPIYGRIPKHAILESPCRIPFDALMTPVLECEFAFRIGKGLPRMDGGWTADNVMEHVASMHSAIEVGERRLSRRQPVPILLLIADASAAGHLVLGPAVAAWARHDLAAQGVIHSVNGIERRRGSGRDVLGHPLNALAWLANELETAGTPLRAGDIVTTGSCTGMAPVSANEKHTADFGPFGQVEVTFD